MTILYYVGLTLVGVAMICSLVDTMFRVSRRTEWRIANFTHACDTQELRHQQLPFVGTERRRATGLSDLGSESSEDKKVIAQAA